jgi:hypothetical protein
MKPLDLVASSMTPHHLRDLTALFSDFRSLLRSSRRVALADLDREDGGFHNPEITDVYHLGFERPEIRGLLSAAGFDMLRASAGARSRRLMLHD